MHVRYGLPPHTFAPPDHPHRNSLTAHRKVADKYGRIYQRPFGGQSKNFGEGGQAARTCAAADRTGHALLHTLYQNNVKNETVFFNEWFATDLVKNQDGAVVGVIAICIETGETVYVKSKATVFATGGAGRIYASTTNAHINTGDGVGMALRADVPVHGQARLL